MLPSTRTRRAAAAAAAAARAAFAPATPHLTRRLPRAQNIIAVAATSTLYIFRV